MYRASIASRGKKGFKPGMKEWRVMDDESMEPMEEVPLVGLGESKLETLVRKAVATFRHEEAIASSLYDR